VKFLKQYFFFNLMILALLENSLQFLIFSLINIVNVIIPLVTHFSMTNLRHQVRYYRFYFRWLCSGL